jgi:prephenate dehydrogenase
MVPCAAAGDAASTPDDLLVVGPGVLGGLVAARWREAHPDAAVVGQTNTTASHARLEALGVTPRLAADAGSRRFPHVLFAAPPSGSENFVGSVRRVGGG